MITNTLFALFLCLPTSLPASTSDGSAGVCELPTASDRILSNIKISAGVRCGWITVQNTGDARTRFRLLQESALGTPGVYLGEFTLGPEASLEVPCQGLEENPSVPTVRAIEPNDNPMGASEALTDILQRESGRWVGCQRKHRAIESGGELRMAHSHHCRNEEDNCPVCKHKAQWEGMGRSHYHHCLYEKEHCLVCSHSVNCSICSNLRMRSCEHRIAEGRRGICGRCAESDRISMDGVRRRGL